MLAATAFDIARFSINTDVEQLISENIPSHQRQLDLSKAFPEKGIIAVVKAPSAENTEQATNALARELSRQSDFFCAKPRNSRQYPWCVTLWCGLGGSFVYLLLCRQTTRADIDDGQCLPHVAAL